MKAEQKKRKIKCFDLHEELQKFVSLALIQSMPAKFQIVNITENIIYKTIFRSGEFRSDIGYIVFVACTTKQWNEKGRVFNCLKQSYGWLPAGEVCTEMWKEYLKERREK